MEEVNDKGVAEVTPSSTEEIKRFEYGDMYVECACGHEQMIAEAVPGGVRFDVYTTDKHDVTLMCTKCNSKLRLFFKEAANPPQPEQPDGENSESPNEPTEVQESDDSTSEDSGRTEPATQEAEETKEINNEPVPETSKAKA